MANLSADLSRDTKFRDRLIDLEQQRRDVVEDRKNVVDEMVNAGLTKEEIGGIKLAVKRSFETETAKEYRETIEAFADSLGAVRDLPLGEAAMARETNARRSKPADTRRTRISAHDITEEPATA